MDDKLKSVLDKIAKLRALAAGAGTPAEAEAAAAQAAALIAKYQIDEAQVEMAGGQAPEEVGEGDVLWQQQGTDDKWRSMLASGLARDHGCAVTVMTRSRFSKARTVLYRIAGRPSDVAIVRYLFAWLHHEIARLSERERGRAAKNAFRLGAVVGVIDAMKKAREQTQAANAAHGQTVALAVVDRATASMDYFKAQAAAAGRKVYTARAPVVADGGAFENGIAAGENLAPRPGLTAADARPMLGSGGR